MISCGLDIGSLWTKAAVVKDGELAAWSLLPSGEDSNQAANRALAEALEKSSASLDQVERITATGAGKGEVEVARDQAADVVCVARGARYLLTDALGVIDLGGESTRVAKLDEQGNVTEFARNDKCAAGTGIFLDEMASVMGVAVEEMGPLSLESTADINITSTCVVFAESEVVSQVARKTPKMDILRGIHRSIATRVFGLASRIGLDGRSAPAGGTIAAIGGLALNIGIVTWLEEMMQRKLTVPENPQIVPAVGAALIGAEKAGGR